MSMSPEASPATHRLASLRRYMMLSIVFGEEGIIGVAESHAASSMTLRLASLRQPP